MTTRESQLLVEEVAAAFGRGEIVVVADDDDRENEGDLLVAASLCTPEKMAFIIRHTSGLVCAPLSAEEAKRLHLDPMVALNDAPLGTAFTVTVDVRHGLTTGISAEERTNTVRALANPNSGATDFVRPGHVLPLLARWLAVGRRAGGAYERRRHGDARRRGETIRGGARPQAHHHRGCHRLPADAGKARQTRKRIPGLDRDRHPQGLCLCDAVRRGVPPGAGARPHRRWPRRADQAAPRQYPARCFRRRSGRARCAAPVRQGRAWRHGIPARRFGGRARRAAAE